MFSFSKVNGLLQCFLNALIKKFHAVARQHFARIPLEEKAKHPLVFMCALMRRLVLLVGLCSKELRPDLAGPVPAKSGVF